MNVLNIAVIALVATVSAVKIDAADSTIPLALMGEHTTQECDHQCVKQHLETIEKLPANVR